MRYDRLRSYCVRELGDLGELGELGGFGGLGKNGGIIVNMMI